MLLQSTPVMIPTRAPSRRSARLPDPLLLVGVEMEERDLVVASIGFGHHVLVVKSVLSRIGFQLEISGPCGGVKLPLRPLYLLFQSSALFLFRMDFRNVILRYVMAYSLEHGVVGLHRFCGAD